MIRCCRGLAPLVCSVAYIDGYAAPDGLSEMSLECGKSGGSGADRSRTVGGRIDTARASGQQFVHSTRYAVGDPHHDCRQSGRRQLPPRGHQRQRLQSRGPDAWSWAQRRRRRIYGGMKFERVIPCRTSNLGRYAVAHLPRPYSAFRQAGVCSNVRKRTDPRLDSG